MNRTDLIMAITDAQNLRESLLDLGYFGEETAIEFHLMKEGLYCLWCSEENWIEEEEGPGRWHFRCAECGFRTGREKTRERAIEIYRRTLERAEWIFAEWGHPQLDQWA